MLNQLLETIIQILTGWCNSFAEWANNIGEDIFSIKTNTDKLPDIKDNTDTIKDNTGAVITPVNAIKVNTDSISQSSQTSANNTTAILNNVGTLSTNTGRAAAFAEDCANNTLEIKDKITTIASDTTQLRADSAELNDMSDKIYEAIKWTLADKYIDETESGPSPMSFDTDIVDDLISCNVGIEFTQSGSGTASLANPRDLIGYSAMNITLNGVTNPISLGDTYYKGVLNVVTGELTITHAVITKVVSDMNNAEAYPGWRNAGVKAIIGSGKSGNYDGVLNIGTSYSCNTSGSNDILYLTSGSYGMTQSEWIAAYPTLNVQVLIPYAAPITVSLTAQQLAAIKGVNTIISDTNGDIEVTYKESIKHYLDKQDN